VHFVELFFEKNKFFRLIGASVQNILVEFLKSVDYFEEVRLSQKELEIFVLRLFDDCFNRETKSILVEVALETCVSEALESADKFGPLTRNSSFIQLLLLRRMLGHLVSRVELRIF